MLLSRSARSGGREAEVRDFVGASRDASSFYQVLCGGGVIVVYRLFTYHVSLGVRWCVLWRTMNTDRARVHP